MRGIKRGSDNDVERRTSLDTAIARSRSNLGETIEALHGRLRPAAFREDVMKQFHEAKETLKSELKGDLLEAKGALRHATIGKVETMIHSTQDSVSATGQSVLDTIKQNPVPSALVGIGLLWMFARSGERRRIGVRVADHAPLRGPDGWSAGSGPLPRASSELGHMAEEAQKTAVQAAHEAREAVGTLAGNIKVSVGEARHAASDKLSALAHDAGDRVSHAAHDAQDQGRKLGGRAQGVFERNPLAVGALVLPAGVAVGLAIPMSRKETRWMGAASKQLRSKAEVLARDAFASAEGAAQQLDWSRPPPATRSSPRPPEVAEDFGASAASVKTPLGGIYVPRLGGAKELDGPGHT
jgi:hypothetical protein